MNRPQLSNPMILTAIKLYMTEHTKIPRLVTQSRMSISYPIYLASAISLVLIPAFLAPKSIVDADVYKQSVSIWSSMTKEAEISTLDLDYQKALDLFKSNPKDVFEEKGLTTQLTIWYYLTEDMGLGDIQAAGIFGNMMVESGSRTFNVSPGIYSPGNAYYGLCQWNTTGHHRDINGGSLDEQLEYLNDTIENEMGSSNYQRFLNATTPEEASIIFGQWYERCGSPRSRQNEARRAYERFAKQDS